MSSKRIGVLISGGGTNLQSIIDNTINGNIKAEVKLVISNRKDAYGLVRARDNGIEALYIDRKEFNSEEEYNNFLVEELESRNIDLIVLAGYLRVLSENFIDAFRNKIINIHPSLIPAFCGKGFYGEKVHQGVIDYGVKITGATVHFVDEGTDTGPIIKQDIVFVSEEDDAISLQKKVLEVEHRLLVESIKLFCEDKILIDGRKVIIN